MPAPGAWQGERWDGTGGLPQMCVSRASRCPPSLSLAPRAAARPPRVCTSTQPALTMPSRELPRLAPQSSPGLRSPGSPRGRAPGESCLPSQPPAPQPRAPQQLLFSGHTDRSGFTSVCSRQKKQKKASSHIVKRHVRLIGQLGGAGVGSPSAQLQGLAPGTQTVPGAGDPGSPARLPTPAAGAPRSRPKEKGRPRCVPARQRRPGSRRARRAARGQPRREYLQNG